MFNGRSRAGSQGPNFGPPGRPWLLQWLRPLRPRGLTPAVAVAGGLVRPGPAAPRACELTPPAGASPPRLRLPRALPWALRRVPAWAARLGFRRVRRIRCSAELHCRTIKATGSSGFKFRRARRCLLKPRKLGWWSIEMGDGARPRPVTRSSGTSGSGPSQCSARSPGRSMIGRFR